MPCDLVEIMSRLRPLKRDWAEIVYYYYYLGRVLPRPRPAIGGGMREVRPREALLVLTFGLL